MKLTPKQKEVIRLIVIICFPIMTFGQIKIGNITIPENLAKKYLLDCYKHPDTVMLKSMWEDKIRNNNVSFSYSYEEERHQKMRVESFNDKVLSSSISRIVDTLWFKDRYDTSYNYMGCRILACTGCTEEFLDKTNNKEILKEKASGIKKIEFIKDHFIALPSSKYLVPRTPSEADFIKWLKNQEE